MKRALSTIIWCCCFICIDANSQAQNSENYQCDENCYVKGDKVFCRKCDSGMEQVNKLRNNYKKFNVSYTFRCTKDATHKWGTIYTKDGVTFQSAQPGKKQSAQPKKHQPGHTKAQNTSNEKLTKCPLCTNGAPIFEYKPKDSQLLMFHWVRCLACGGTKRLGNEPCTHCTNVTIYNDESVKPGYVRDTYKCKLPVYYCNICQKYFTIKGGIIPTYQDGNYPMLEEYSNQY